MASDQLKRHIFHNILLILVILSVALFVIETVFNLSEQALRVINILHSIVFIMFIVDLYLEYRKIGDFKKFVKKYWIEILIMVVFSSLGRIFRAFGVLRHASSVGEELGRTSRILIFARANFHIYRVKNVMRKTMYMALLFSRAKKQY